MYRLTFIENLTCNITGIWLSANLFLSHLNDYNIGVSFIVYISGCIVIPWGLKMMIFVIKNNTGGGSWQ